MPVTPEQVARVVQHFCSSCTVGLHDACLTLESPDATCLCASEGHKPDLHPALSGVLWKREQVGARSGEMRDIDPEREPFEQRGPGGVSETHATKSKPRDDEDQAREDNDRYLERQTARAMMPWRF